MHKRVTRQRTYEWGLLHHVIYAEFDPGLNHAQSYDLGKLFRERWFKDKDGQSPGRGHQGASLLCVALREFAMLAGQQVTIRKELRGTSGQRKAA